MASLFLALASCRWADAGKEPSKTPTPSIPAKAKLLDLIQRQKKSCSPCRGSATTPEVIDGRPYKMKTDLGRKKVVPQATYDKIASMVMRSNLGGARD